MNNTVEQQQESFNILLIDGDPIAFIIGWNHRDHQDEFECFRAVDVWMQDLLAMTRAEKYMLVLGPSAPQYFRNDLYRFKPYKGNRKEQENWVSFWEPRIRMYLLTKWNAVFSYPELETDDVLSIMHEYLRTTQPGTQVVIGSPDKDMRQIEGIHLDFRKLGTDKFTGLEMVGAEQARRNFWMQMLTGDDTDNVAGVPKIGEVKAKALLNETDPMMWQSMVQLQYQKYFGDFYGNMIYHETFGTLKLISSTHSYPASESYIAWCQEICAEAIITV
jgi:hypothetical protein